MATVIPKFKFGFVLKSGNPNVRNYPEQSTTQTFNKGSLVKLNAAGTVSDMTTESDSTSTVTVESGCFGIAGKDATGVANSLIPVYVITPEQEWEVHAEQGKKPNTDGALDLGDAVKLMYSASTSYTLSNGTTSTNTTVVGHRRGEEGTKGGRVIIRFTPLMCGAIY
jgi:hypothetical protein